jgi:type II secretory pathway pseudopilin PulG
VRSRRRAFTIVELLVVITIIMILIGLLLPAVAAAYRAAMEYECQNNLHQLAVVVATYCADNDGYFPRTTDPSVTGGPSANDWLYLNNSPTAPNIAKGILLSSRRVGKNDLYYCPIDVDNGLPLKDGQVGSDSSFSPPKRQMSYLINGSITYGNTGTERRVRRFADFDPNDFLFIEESSGIAPDLPSAFDQAYMTPESKYTITKRHHGGGYVAYMDGSVQWWSQEDFNIEAARVTGTDWYKNATDGSNTPNHWNPG